MTIGMADDDYETFPKKQARAERLGRIDRLFNAPPIGFLPNGELDTDLDFKPRIIPDKPK
jgi:hypothetical protein